jgi:hypothetical protein
MNRESGQVTARHRSWTTESFDGSQNRLQTSKKRVANLWTEFATLDRQRTVADGTECKNLSKPLVAATFEKTKTYVFAATAIWDREVGGSNPLAPTTIFS